MLTNNGHKCRCKHIKLDNNTTPESVGRNTSFKFKYDNSVRQNLKKMGIQITERGVKKSHRDTEGFNYTLVKLKDTVKVTITRKNVGKLMATGSSMLIFAVHENEEYQQEMISRTPISEVVDPPTFRVGLFQIGKYNRVWGCVTEVTTPMTDYMTVLVQFKTLSNVWKPSETSK